MKIALRNSDKSPVWSIPGTAILLTFENPGPMDVNLDSLTPAQRSVIAGAHSRGVLLVDKPDELYSKATPDVPTAPVQGGGSLAKSYASPKVAPRLPVIPPTSEVLKPETINNDRRRPLIDLLDSGVATIKKSLPSKSLSELRDLLELEKKGKNRKSIITPITQLIEKHQKDVFNVVGNVDDIVITAPKAHNLENVGDVVEFDDDRKEVVIKMGTDE